MPVNLSEKQRIISTLAGSTLLALGVLDWSKSSLRRAVRMTLGSLLIMRGISGYCPAVARHLERQRKESDELDEALRREDIAAAQGYDAD